MANEWDLERIQRTIAIYVDRNNVAHSHIDEPAPEDHFKLATKMVEDLKALADTPACCRDKIDTAKQAIASMPCAPTEAAGPNSSGGCGAGCT